MPEILGKSESLIVLRKKGKKYLVTRIQFASKGNLVHEGGEIMADREAETVVAFTCRGEDGQKRQFRANMKGFVAAYQELVEEEQRTGSKMFVIIDADLGEWKTYNMNQIGEENPVIAEFLKRMKRKGQEYIR